MKWQNIKVGDHQAFYAAMPAPIDWRWRQYLERFKTLRDALEAFEGHLHAGPSIGSRTYRHLDRCNLRRLFGVAWRGRESMSISQAEIEKMILTAREWAER